ncbi:MAG: serine hydrolase domain-containing protein, partial [Planctomycetota bacterium]
WSPGIVVLMHHHPHLHRRSRLAVMFGVLILLTICLTPWSTAETSVSLQPADGDASTAALPTDPTASTTNASATLTCTSASLRDGARLELKQRLIIAIEAAEIPAARIPAMVVGVYEGGERYVLGFGSLPTTAADAADDRPSSNATAPDGQTIFEIGSITKAFTGILLADAVMRGDVQLDDPIGPLLPQDVRAGMGDLAQITLEQLATHRSSLPRLPANLRPDDPLDPYAAYSVKRLHTWLAQGVMLPPPGERYAYSNLGAGLLGHLLARYAALQRARIDLDGIDDGGDNDPNDPAQGEADQRQQFEEAIGGTASLDRLLRDRITNPLSMRDTTFILNDEQRDRLAPPHAFGRRSKNWDLASLGGAGGIRSTVDDMLQFIAANVKAHFASDAAANAIGLNVERDQTLIGALRFAAVPRHRIEGPLGGQGIGIALGWHTQQIQTQPQPGPAADSTAAHLNGPDVDATASASAASAAAAAAAAADDDDDTAAPAAESSFSPSTATVEQAAVMIWHNGQTGGYKSMLMIGSAAKRGVVILSNGTESQMIDGLAARLMALLAE